MFDEVVAEVQPLDGRQFTHAVREVCDLVVLQEQTSERGQSANVPTHALQRVVVEVEHLQLRHVAERVRQL